MYIARQPIFDREMNVYAYELLYRSSIDSVQFGNTSMTAATATVLAGLFEDGIEIITGNKKAFVNFDEEILLADHSFDMDPGKIVIEVLEGVKSSEKLISRLNEIRKKGYWIALDDFEEDYDNFPLVKQAHIIKYDLMKTPLDSLTDEVKKALSDKKILLAEKVETQEEFLKAKEMGFHLFQGYFFQKPYIIGKSENKAPSSMQYAMILSELNEEEPSYDKIAKIFESNIDLAYKVIKRAGSKHFEESVTSIKRALTYMGLKELKFWVSILMIKEVSSDKPPELVRISLIRAKFADLLSQTKVFDTQASEAFMLGMFSVIDALLDKKMEDIVKDMPFSEELKKALLGKGGKLNELLDFIKEYEHGNFEKDSKDIMIDSRNLNIVSKLYFEALRWANKTFESMDSK